MIISKDVYDRIIKKFQVNQIDNIIQFYSNLPTLSVAKDTIMSLATKTKISKAKSHVVFIKERDEVEQVWFIRLGKCNVIKTIKVNNKIKHLKIDELSSGDMFGHHDLENNGRFSFSIITQLPTEFYGVAKTDYKFLPMETRLNFAEYAKPYPNASVIRKNYFDNKRWIKFQKACRDNIYNSKINTAELWNPFKTTRGKVNRFINAIDILIDRKPLPKPITRGLLSDTSSSSSSRSKFQPLPTVQKAEKNQFNIKLESKQKSMPLLMPKNAQSSNKNKSSNEIAFR